MKKVSFFAIVVLVALGLFTACPPKDLQANFRWTPALPIAGQLVSFHDASRGSPTQWQWDFGDGDIDDTAVGRNATHSYAAAGTFPVILTVANADGIEKSVTKTITVASALVAQFTWDSFAEAETPLQFTDASAGVPTSWLWNFGDGATATVKNPLHTYAAAGTFNVALTVSNAGGPKTITKPVIVQVSLKVNFTWTPTLPIGGQEVQFTDLSIGVGIVSWLWDFGDGGTSTLQNPKHTFVNATGVNKNFTVTLTITNEHGTVATLTISPLPIT